MGSSVQEYISNLPVGDVPLAERTYFARKDSLSTLRNGRLLRGAFVGSQTDVENDHGTPNLIFDAERIEEIVEVDNTSTIEIVRVVLKSGS